MDRVARVNMVTKRALGLFAFLAALVACQPQVVTVAVTRIVEVTSTSSTATAASVVEPTPATQPGQVVEVTRLVELEVTRVVTSTFTTESQMVATRPAAGTDERPFRLLFSPIAATNVVNLRGRVLAETLTGASGFRFDVGITDDEGSLITLLCEAPEETIGFLSATAYVVAHDLCGAQIGSVAVREDGLTWQAGMIVTRRDSGIRAFEDLEGKVWAVPDAGNIPRALYFQAMLAAASVQVAETRLVAGDSSAMLAVYSGEADFATASYTPPILPFEERLWDYERDSPEIWRRLGIPPSRSPIGYVLVNGEPEFGGYRLRDARSRIIDIAPGIYDETLIVSLSAPIPNDTVVFGANFPLGASREILAALQQFAATEACIASLCSVDFYGWTGLEVIEETAFDPLRFMIETLDLPPDELLRP